MLTPLLKIWEVGNIGNPLMPKDNSYFRKCLKSAEIIFGTSLFLRKTASFNFPTP